MIDIRLLSRYGHERMFIFVSLVYKAGTYCLLWSRNM